MTGRVTGIGGVFFRAEDPKALAEWYTRHLGVTIEDFWPQEAGNAVLAPFKADTDYWSTDKQWMIISASVRWLIWWSGCKPRGSPLNAALSGTAPGLAGSRGLLTPRGTQSSCGNRPRAKGGPCG